MATSDAETSGNSSFRVYDPRSLGAGIRHFRQQAGLHQAELAATSGINRSYLSHLEQGQETEQLARLFRVLRQLGVRITLERTDW